MFQLGKIAVAVFWIPVFGALFDDDLERFSLVFVQHVVQRATGACANASATAALSRKENDVRPYRNEPENGDDGCNLWIHALLSYTFLAFHRPRLNTTALTTASVE